MSRTETEWGRKRKCEIAAIRADRGGEQWSEASGTRRKESTQRRGRANQVKRGITATKNEAYET